MFRQLLSSAVLLRKQELNGRLERLKGKPPLLS